MTLDKISFNEFLKKKFLLLFIANIPICAILFFLPWYFLLPALLITPYFQLIIPSFGLNKNDWHSDLSTGFKFSASSFFPSIITLLLIGILIAVLLQPIAFAGSLVESEMRGPTFFPDILDLICDFIEKIINNYGQNGLFWTNVLRQIVYIVAIILIIPLYTIQSLLLFTNMQEIKQVKGLWKEYEKFGNRDRFKETSFED
jgi:hypothetical protein